jgi:hypothetical protein
MILNLTSIFYDDEHLCRTFTANTLIRSSGVLRSRSAAELLLTQKTELPCHHDGLLWKIRLHALKTYVDVKVIGHNCTRIHLHVFLTILLWIGYDAAYRMLQ